MVFVGNVARVEVMRSVLRIYSENFKRTDHLRILGGSQRIILEMTFKRRNICGFD
jgi:hypothetical protein